MPISPVGLVGAGQPQLARPNFAASQQAAPPEVRERGLPVWELRHSPTEYLRVACELVAKGVRISTMRN